MAEGAKLVPFPASGRSRDAGGGEEGPGSPPSIALLEAARIVLHLGA